MKINCSTIFQENHFLLCILPNRFKRNDVYEDHYVLSQLLNTNILAYRNSLNVIIDTVNDSHENDDGFIEEVLNESEEIETKENDNGFIEGDINQPTEKPKNNPTPNKKRRTHTTKQETRPAEDVRYDNIGHFPDVDHNENPTRCKHEGCKLKSHIFCDKCMVHLCLKLDKNCFMKFHIDATETETHEE